MYLAHREASLYIKYPVFCTATQVNLLIILAYKSSWHNPILVGPRLPTGLLYGSKCYSQSKTRDGTKLVEGMCRYFSFFRCHFRREKQKGKAKQIFKNKITQKDKNKRLKAFINCIKKLLCVNSFSCEYELAVNVQNKFCLIKWRSQTA